MAILRTNPPRGGGGAFFGRLSVLGSVLDETYDGTVSRTFTSSTHAIGTKPLRQPVVLPQGEAGRCRALEYM